MGISGISWGEILIILLVVILIFGTGKLSRIGSDLGNAIRGFRAAMKDEAAEPHAKDPSHAKDQSMDAEHPAKR